MKNLMRNPSHVPKDILKLVNQDSVMAATHTSEMSVASELSNAIGDEAMESGIDPNEENCTVDHMPPPAPSLLLRRSTSVKEQAPIKEMDDEDDDDEENYFGPVVDHTPTVSLQPFPLLLV
jgi:hypothetical protein